MQTVARLVADAWPRHTTRLHHRSSRCALPPRGGVPQFPSMSTARVPYLEAQLARLAEVRGCLCVGLDPDPQRLPAGVGAGAEGVRAFCLAIIGATAPHAAAFKPNSAFFEALGPAGCAVLAEVIAAARRQAPVILDAKRGDIGSTATMYARAAFEAFGADAVTVNPSLGNDTMAPFLAWRDRGVFALCATSNPGADDFWLPGGLRDRVAAAWRGWHAENANAGLVVGATRPADLAAVRAQCAEAMILVPGVGAQGGDLAATLRAGASPAGPRLLVNASRAILHASAGADFAEAAARAARQLSEETSP
jgi:orotidine-5'-phosphate decarboxylase